MVKSTYTDRKMPIMKFHSNSYDNLINLIKPYMLWKCFDYKIKHRKSIPQHLQSQVKLTESDVRNIFQMRSDGFTNVSISKKYNVHKNHISAILNRKLWKHVNLNINNLL